MEIRRASAADAEAVLDCCRQVGGETDYLTFGAEGVAVTVEEEREYLRRYAQGDQEARDVLIERNLRLVAHIIKNG